MRNSIFHADNLELLRTLADGCIELIYIDPPFNTGKRQKRTRLKTVRDRDGDRTGFGGHRYRTESLGSSSFEDDFDDYLGFLAPRLEEMRRCLSDQGSLFLHVDYREVHYCKILLDRIPYMAPGLVGPEKAARGKTPTDVWWHTIVSPTGKERTGYPTQKPLGILERVVRGHSSPGALVADFFAGSGSFGEAAARNGRDYLLVDSNPEAIDVMAKRLGSQGPAPDVRRLSSPLR